MLDLSTKENFDSIREDVKTLGVKVSGSIWKLESCEFEERTNADGFEDEINAPGLVRAIYRKPFNGEESIEILEGSYDSLKFLAMSTK